MSNNRDIKAAASVSAAVVSIEEEKASYCDILAADPFSQHQCVLYRNSCVLEAEWDVSACLNRPAVITDTHTHTHTHTRVKLKNAS